jgi:hypothetical protein
MLVHGTALDWYAVHTTAIALSSPAAPSTMKKLGLVELHLGEIDPQAGSGRFPW